MCTDSRFRVVVVFLFLIVAGCGSESANKVSQVVAKVDGKEISVHQLNEKLSAMNVNDSHSVEQMQRSVLAKLVEEQLVYNAAIDDNLDRNPAVVSAIENARRNIIAKAYLDKFIAGLSKPSEAEQRAYFDQNPALFKRRKIYTLQELSVEPNETILDELKFRANKGEALEDIAGWLKAEGVQYQANAAQRAAEQIGLELLERIAELEDGDTVVFTGPDSYLVARIIQSTEAPIKFELAQQRISQFLINAKARDLMQEELGKLRAQADIKYVGKFAALVEGTAEKSKINPNDKTGSEIGTIDVDEASLN